MAKRLEVYKCDRCGNVIEVVCGGPGEMSCCGQAMKHLDENTVDAAREKHVPVINRTAAGLEVTVGSVPHPMEEKHFITFIEVINGDRVCRIDLKPGQPPKAVFNAPSGKVKVREYCNLHGVWQSEG